MTPTTKLRWKKVQHKDRPYADLTLQQWWQGEYSGEWRDVPVEVE